MAAAAQEVSSVAFWFVHDFFFTAEGQNVAKLEKKLLQIRVEQLLRDKKVDVKAFQAALESGKGRQRVLDDMALGKNCGSQEPHESCQWRHHRGIHCG